MFLKFAFRILRQIAVHNIFLTKLNNHYFVSTEKKTTAPMKKQVWQCILLL